MNKTKKPPLWKRGRDSGFIVLWDEDRDINLRLHRMDIPAITNKRSRAVRIANEAIERAMKCA